LALIEAPFAQFGMPGAGEAISVIFMGLLWALNMAASGLQAHLDASGKVWGTVKIIAEIAGLWIGYTALLWIIMNIMDLVDSRYP
jgi:hypothetical protein